MRARLPILTVLGFAVVATFILWARGMFAMNEPESAHDRMPSPDQPSGPVPSGLQKATFGNGCFWCTEAVFQQLKGVETVVPGYSGGTVKNPTYEQVCTGKTGHAEAVQITYDPKVVSFADLLEVFWRTHDPTTLNRQGYDKGTQYRSAVFYHNEEQKKLAEEYKQKLDKSGAFDAPIVTEITAFSEFFPAEKYHQNYFVDNPREGYCVAVIGPKLEKFKRVFKDKLKTPPPK
jgi:methionine-S-sulfoxide reductase